MSYEHTEMDLGEVTVVKPNRDLKFTNDIGKTSIIRALNIVLFHEAFPEKWIRNGCDSAYIEVITTSGVTVRRAWNGKTQSTTIKQPNQPDVAVTGTKDISSFVRSLLGFNKVKVDQTSDPENINIIGADADNVFLKDRADSLLRKLSALLGSHRMEDVSVGIQRDIRNLTSEKTTLDKLLKEEESRLEGKKEKAKKVAELLITYKEVEAKLEQTRAKLKQLQDLKIKVDDLKVLSNIEVQRKVEYVKQLIVNIKNDLIVINLLKEHQKLRDLQKLKAEKQKEVAELKKQLKLIPKCDKCGKPL